MENQVTDYCRGLAVIMASEMATLPHVTGEDLRAAARLIAERTDDQWFEGLRDHEGARDGLLAEYPAHKP